MSYSKHKKVLSREEKYRMKTGKLKERHFEKLAEYSIYAGELTDCVCLKYKAGETILQEGMPISSLLVVVGGKAKVCVSAPNGRNLVLCYYVSNGILGDVEMMMNTPESNSSIVALTDFECLSIPYRNNIEKLKCNNEFLNKLAYEISAKLIRSSENLASAALYSGEERLCTYILQTAHKDIFSDTLTDTAASVGMSYRHMFRILTGLCDEGILQKKKSGYNIADRRRLEEKAIAGRV